MELLVCKQMHVSPTRHHSVLSSGGGPACQAGAVKGGDVEPGQAPADAGRGSLRNVT